MASSFISIVDTLSSESAVYPGTLSSLPRSNNSCCIFVKNLDISSGSASHKSIPIMQFSSSTVPIASMRSLHFNVRVPSPSPVEPPSPVFV